MSALSAWGRMPVAWPLGRPRLSSKGDVDPQCSTEPGSAKLCRSEECSHHRPENVLRIEVQQTNPLRQPLMHLPPLEKPVDHQRVDAYRWVTSLQLGSTAEHENQKKEDERGHICAPQIDFSSVLRLEKCLLSLRPAQKVLDSAQ